MCVCVCICVCVCVLLLLLLLGSSLSFMHVWLNNKDIFCVYNFIKILWSFLISVLVSGVNWWMNLPKLSRALSDLSLAIIYIYIYIYIVIHRQTVSLYHNSSVLLDRQDSRSWNRNLADWNANPRFCHEETSASEENLNAYVSHLFCLHISA